MVGGKVSVIEATEASVYLCRALKDSFKEVKAMTPIPVVVMVATT
jgi:hypothetical protein